MASYVTSYVNNYLQYSNPAVSFYSQNHSRLYNYWQAYKPSYGKWRKIDKETIRPHLLESLKVVNLYYSPGIISND